MNGSVMPRPFVAPVELAIWEPFGYAAVVRRPVLRSGGTCGHHSDMRLLAHFPFGPRGSTVSLTDVMIPVRRPDSVNSGPSLGLTKPALGNMHVRMVERGDGCAPEQPERALQIRSQDLNRAGDPRFASRGQAVRIGSSTQHGASAQADCLDDVGASTNASIHQYFYLPVYRGRDLRQSSQGSGNAVELPAAMVRYRNRRDSLINGTPRVIAGQDAFDDDGAVPQITNPTQVCPRHRGGRERGIDIDKWHRPLAWDDDVRERRQTAVTQETDQPRRMGQDLRKKRDLLQQAPADELFHAVAVVALTESGDGGVDGHDQRGVPRNPCSFNHRFGGIATANKRQLIDDRTGGHRL